MTLLLNRQEVAQRLAWDPLLAALRDALIALSEGRASAPARIATRSPAGLLAAMPGTLDAVMAAKLVTVFAGNHQMQGGAAMPSHQALITMFDAADGRPLAVMDGTEITMARTAAVSALATQALARPEARVLAVIGTGTQARGHLRALRHVMRFEEIWVAGRNPDHVAAVAAECDAHPAPDIETAVRSADVICCCTDAPEPVVRVEWLRPGAHVNSIGIGGQEVDAVLLRAARLAVESRVAFLPFPIGAHELQGMDAGAAVELGEIFADRAPGRRDPQEWTVYKSVGHAVEDAAAAKLVYERARADGGGTRFDFG